MITLTEDTATTATTVDTADAAATAAIHALIERTAQAWGSMDGAGYGECFTPDASYVTWVGTLYRGRADIAEAHQVLFSKFLKGTRLAEMILETRFYGPDTAIVNTRGDVYKGKRPADSKLSKAQTYTVVRGNDGEWLIAAFQNTKRKSLMERISFKFAPKTIPAADR